ncbi:MAG: cold shock domain-containing protein [Deltaproteobacteria bacterium]|jgi:cold shock CspA family protein|nr:cold shock domain-containing protein [Deltaproteobacteria bacterium]
MANTGKVSKIIRNNDDNERGYGFIKTDSNEDLYFLLTDVIGDRAAINSGDKVEYVPDMAKGKPVAKKVKVIAPLKVVGSSSSSYSGGGSFPAASSGLPEGTVFSTFYDQDGRLCQSLFFEAAQTVAEIFGRAELKPTQFRMIYQQFLSFITLLRRNDNYFPEAREKFATLYVERIERACKRNIFKPIVKEFFERHRVVVQSSPKEMLGFFRYLTNILCYLRDSSR